MSQPHDPSEHREVRSTAVENREVRSTAVENREVRSTAVENREVRSTAVEDSPTSPAAAGVRGARLWRADGWTARVIKNQDDEGWAVEMTREGDPEPALVGPWTMGRDKKNPKPLDAAAFTTLVKTASEVIRRHEHQRHALLHKSVTVADAPDGPVRVTLDIVPDEDDPHALLSATDRAGNPLGQCRVAPDFKLSPASASRWIESGYQAP